MRALVCDDFKGVSLLRVGELPEPEPGEGSLLIEVASVAVNFADTLTVSGLYQMRPETPFAPGYELAGTVVESHDDRFAVGDRVCGTVTHGAMAERAVIVAEQAARLPDAIDFDSGAVIPATYGTSYHALADRAALAAGETLLVLGAAGGVGLAALQIGKAFGATVIAAVSSGEKEDLVVAQGADAVIRYDREDLREGIKRVTSGAGVDVVYDPVGGEVTEAALRSTRWRGRLLVVGFAAGPIPSIPMNLPLLKGNSLVGVFWGRFSAEEPDRARENLAAILTMVEDGRLEPVIQRRFDLEEGVEAMHWVSDRRALGRVVINP